MLVAEIACETDERLWLDEEFAETSVLRELHQAEGLLSPAEATQTHVYRSTPTPIRSIC